MNLKTVLVVGVLGLSLAACSGANTTTSDADNSSNAAAAPSAFELQLDATIASCHKAIAETDNWRELDGGAMYELAKDVIKENPDAVRSNGSGFNASGLAATRCARNMNLYANGGATPAGLES